MPVKTLGGKGRWRAEISLTEKAATASDGIVEVTLPSVITATAPSHDANGLPDGGTVTAVLKMGSIVVSPPPTPTVTITAGSNSIIASASYTLTWSSTNATSCNAAGAWSGSKATSGSQSTGALSTNSTFTLTCTGLGGSANQSATVTVTAVPPPPPPPPHIDTILSAWMLDVNGNGAADQARFRFTRALSALPASIGPVYWNNVAPQFANSKPPVLSFLAGSGQTIVVADFTGAEFQAGLTSIPAGTAAGAGAGAGARPQATFPSDTVFGGQKPQLADSMGAIPLSAIIALGGSGVAVAKGNSIVRIPDTLTITVSEPLRPGFANLVRFGKWKDDRCFDRGPSQPITPLTTSRSRPDSLTYVLILNPLAANPISGDCAYLEGDGSVLDAPGNAPAPLGVRITGPKPPQDIRSTVGYPAISGGGHANPETFKAPLWIPPVGFTPGTSFSETTLPTPGQSASSADPNRLQTLDPSTVLVKVVSAGKYLVHAHLFDNLGNFVTAFDQSFGYKGELENIDRLEPLGYHSFLVWDGRDQKGRLAGQGVIIWKIDFVLDDGTRFNQYVRTGLLR